MFLHRENKMKVLFLLMSFWVGLCFPAHADDLKIATVFPDDNKKYITTKLSEPIDDNPELISNRIKLVGFEVI